MLGLLLLGGIGVGALFLTGNGKRLTGLPSAADATQTEEASTDGKTPNAKGKKTSKKKEPPAPRACKTPAWSSRNWPAPT